MNVTSSLIRTIILTHTLLNICILLIKKTRTQGSSILLALTNLVFICIPLENLISGTKKSRLSLIGFAGVSDEVKLIQAASIIGISFAAFTLGNVIVGLKTINHEKYRLIKHIDDQSLELRIWKMLGLLGLLGYFLGIYIGLGVNSRASYGQGIPTFLLHSWMIAPAIAVMNNHWNKKKYIFFSIIQLLLLLGISGARSSLTLISIAFFIILIKKMESSGNKLKLITISIVLTYITLLALQFIPLARSNIRFGNFNWTNYSTIAAHPFENITQIGGFDSLEGAILALNVDRSLVNANLLDPLKAFTTFVPRQIWDSKPEFLGPQLTQRYSMVRGNAGLVISGAAYTYLITDTFIAVIIIFLALGLCNAKFASSERSIIYRLFLLHFSVRFYIGGDSFDLFFVLQDLLLYKIARGIVKNDKKLKSLITGI